MKKPSFAEFLRDERGATAIEYALIAGTISICITAALMLASGSLKGIFTNVASGLTSNG